MTFELGNHVSAAASAPGDPKTAVGPFLKWAGGKRRLLKRILPFVPDRFENYFEPFLGGGAVYFAVRDRAAGTCHLSDLNEDLMNAWMTFRDQPAAVLRQLQWYAENDCKEFYYEQRPKQPMEVVDRAARFYYLNKTSWNGLWRVNQKGEFNVPWGQRDFRPPDADALEALSDVLLDSTELYQEDFRTVLDKASEGDFVYLDPPYLPISDTSKFYFYTQKRFREPDLRDLAGICQDLSERGVTWVLSNRDTEAVRDLFSGANIERLHTRRSVAAQNRRDIENARSPEAIIYGGPR